MPAASELIATGRTNAEIAEQIGCDKMFYQTIEDLVEACSIGENPPSRFDSSCFDGNYVTGDVTADYLAELELARHDDAKQGIDMGDEIIEIHNEA
jgi:amidophosphoribosyltransferase